VSKKKTKYKIKKRKKKEPREVGGSGPVVYGEMNGFPQKKNKKQLLSFLFFFNILSLFYPYITQSPLVLPQLSQRFFSFPRHTTTV
jgi:hypothetical protein